MHPIIEKLASKELSTCGCCHERSKKHVYIGDVLAKTRNQTQDTDAKIIGLWAKCGINKSLQQIESESGYEEVECSKCSPPVEHGVCNSVIKRLKNPKTRALFEFLDLILN